MPEITAPAAVPSLAPGTPAPATLVESRATPTRRTSRLRRLAAAVASTHRAVVPF